MTINDLILSIIAGIAGTFVMDFTNLLLSKLKVISSVQPLMLGRLAHGWAKGKFIYDNASSVENVNFEYLKGQLTHYSIGIALSFFYVFIVVFSDINVNIILWAVIYGVLTTIIAWFLLFPSMGFGVAGKKAPKEARMSRTSLVNHFHYGVGLALGYYFLKMIPFFENSVFLQKF